MAVFGAQHTLKVYTADDAEYLHITEEEGTMGLTMKDTSTDLAVVDKPVHVPLLTTDDLTIGSNTLMVNTANNRIAIGHSDPQAPLDVDGSIIASGGLTVGGGVSCNSVNATWGILTGTVIASGVVNCGGGGFQFPYGAIPGDLPTGLDASNTGRCMFCVSDNKLYIWNGTAWRSVQFNA